MVDLLCHGYAELLAENVTKTIVGLLLGLYTGWGWTVHTPGPILADLSQMSNEVFQYISLGRVHRYVGVFKEVNPLVLLFLFVPADYFEPTIAPRAKCRDVG
jgi:hypothetical protein